MSLKNTMRDMAAHLNAGAFDRIEAYYGDTCMVSDPNHTPWPRGREGARQMADSFRNLAQGLKVEIEDMIEEDDRVAVRWRFTGVRDGHPFVASIMAIYRFEDGRIAEQWTLGAPKPWPS